MEGGGEGGGEECGGEEEEGGGWREPSSCPMPVSPVWRVSEGVSE